VYLILFLYFQRYLTNKIYGCRETLVNNCPVCGEDLGKYDNMNDIIHMTLCFDEGTGNQIMTGGFLTEKQASYGYFLKYILLNCSSKWKTYKPQLTASFFLYMFCSTALLFLLPHVDTIYILKLQWSACKASVIFYRLI
jgi:hypothetical protein